MTRTQQTELTAYMRNHYDAESVYVYNYGDNEPQQVQVFANKHQRFLVEIIGDKCHVYTFSEGVKLAGK